MTRKKKILGAASSATAGAGLGYAATIATETSAVGVIGGGAGWGAPAGPIGIAIGALAGLALFGLYKAFKR